MKTLTIALASALLATGAAQAQTQTSGPTPGPHSGEPATIPFANFGNIYNFEAAPDGNGIYLQDRARNWYYASLFGFCNELPWAHAIGVKTWGFDTVDDSATLLVGREQCRIQKLVHSGPPPKRAKKKH